MCFYTIVDMLGILETLGSILKFVLILMIDEITGRELIFIAILFHISKTE